jgi:hypothetical protein
MTYKLINIRIALNIREKRGPNFLVNGRREEEFIINTLMFVI